MLYVYYMFCFYYMPCMPYMFVLFSYNKINNTVFGLVHWGGREKLESGWCSDVVLSTVR